MKPSTRRVKLASLMLGVLAGFALLTVPALLSVGTTSKANTPGTTGPNVLGPAQYGRLANLYGLDKSPAYPVLLPIVLIVLFVLIPAVALSFLAREWAVRRTSRS